MKLLNHIKVICKAWKASLGGEIPTKLDDSPEWYIRRMTLCKQCPHNTANMTDKEISEGGAKTLGGRKRHRCSICGCFLKEKCWSKTEQCSLAEQGERPLWRKMEIITEGKDDLDLINESDNDNIDIRLSEDGTHFVLDLGDVMVNTRTPFMIGVRTKRDCFMDKPVASCGCIREVKLTADDSRMFHVGATFASDNYALGPIRYKSITLSYLFDVKEKNEMKVDVVGVIIENPDNPSIPKPQ